MYDIYITGSIGYDVTEEWFKEQLAAAGGGAVRLLINSGGGSVFAGMGLIAMIRDYPGQVTAEITGLAASMASALAVACDKVIILENISVLMVHLSSMSTHGNTKDYQKSIEIMEGINKQLIGLYQNKSGLSEKKLRAMMEEETWLFGEEILNLGFADEMKPADVTDTVISLPEAKAKFAACYRQPTPADVAAYSNNTGSQGEAVKLRAWTAADPDNEELSKVVKTAIASGKTEAQVKSKLLEAVQGYGGALTDEDLAAAKAARMSPADYRKAQSYLKQF